MVAMDLSTLRHRPLLLAVVATGVALVAALVAGVAVNAFTDDGPSTPKTDATLHLDQSDKDPQPAVEGDQAGKPVPTASFAMLDGSTRTLAAYRGKPMVVNFFASWCVPCRTEMPDLQKVHQQLGEKVVFVGLAVRDEENDAAAFVKRSGATYDTGRDPSGKIFSDLGGINMPSTYFVSPDGRVVGDHPGALTAGKLRSLVQQYLHVS